MQALTLRFPDDLDPQQFLDRYWQKQPLLIRQALPGFESPLEPDDLAGLACEEDIESRLVLEKDGTRPWQVRHGPFTEADFAGLPQTHWTLLVQDVEKHLPDLQTITRLFRFIPDWRIDDLMISFAPEAGSVGPHTDQYDVFLLQAHGRRRWEIASSYNPELLENIDLKILQQFHAEQSWVLEPGDMLYLPPGIAHHGVAEGDCMTFSIGFRAPTSQQLGDVVLSRILEQQQEQFYHDPDLESQQLPAEISASARHQLRQMVRDQLGISDDELDDMTCCWLSEPKAGLFEPWENPDMDQPAFLQHWESVPLLQHPATRFLFSRHDDGIRLYINGDRYELDCAEEDTLKLLTTQHSHQLSDYATSSCFMTITDILYQSWRKGVFCFDD